MWVFLFLVLRRLCRWCIKALAATRDNTDAAADWILTNQEKLEEQARVAEAKAAEEAKRKQLEEESSFFMNLGGFGGLPHSAPTTGACYQCAYALVHWLSM
jgi:hypothetical protein